VIPVFVDHTSGPTAAVGSVVMNTCFHDPTLPQNDPRRSPSGVKFLDAAFTVQGVFTNPTNAGNQVWRSDFTPYTPGTGTPNAAGTREAQGVVPMPYTVSVKRVKARRGFFRLAGRLNLNGSAPSGVLLRLYGGTRGKNGIIFNPLSSTHTRKGNYAFNRRLPRKLSYFFVERPPTTASCGTSPLAIPCTSSIVSNAISSVVKVPAAPKKKRHHR
jgi:hypothetical protein